MEEDQLRKYVTHKNWRWVPGMKAVGRKGAPLAWFRLEEDVYRLQGEWSEALPDLEDPATLGALLHLLRYLYADPARLWGGRLEVRQDHRTIFEVVRPFHDTKGALCYETMATGVTEAEALLRTLVREGGL